MYESIKRTKVLRLSVPVSIVDLPVNTAVYKFDSIAMILVEINYERVWTRIFEERFVAWTKTLTLAQNEKQHKC